MPPQGTCRPADATEAPRRRRKPDPTRGRLSPRLTRREEDELLRLLGDGVSRARVARMLGLSYRMVQTVAERAEHKGLLQPLRAKAAARIGAILEEEIDAKLESSGDMDGISFGILFDKHALLSQEPVEPAKASQLDTVDELVARLKRANEVIDIDNGPPHAGPAEGRRTGA